MSRARRVAAVRMDSSPLVEVRRLWPRNTTRSDEVAADTVATALLADERWCTDPRLAGMFPLTGRADGYRVGLAGTCRAQDLPAALADLDRRLDPRRVPPEAVALLRARLGDEAAHRRSGLDERADEKCFARLLGEIGRCTPEDLAAVQPEHVTAALLRLRDAPDLTVLVGALDPADYRTVDIDAGAARTETGVPRPRPVLSASGAGDRTACRLAAVVPLCPAAIVTADLLGGHPSAVLVRTLRESLGWSYDVRCGLDRHGPTTVLVVRCTVEAERERQAMARIREAVRALASAPPLPADLELARAHAAGSRLLNRATQASLATELVTVLGHGMPLPEPEGLRGVGVEEATVFAREFLADCAED
jgi:hypothetical protein